MQDKTNLEFIIPADVPSTMHKEYLENYQAITHNTGNLMLFSCNQKIEYINRDLFGPDINQEIISPEHLFYIASHGIIGAMETQLGLIARYGFLHAAVNYIVHLNSKTDIIPSIERDPRSEQLWSVENVMAFKRQSNLKIRGVSYTLYIGSEFEWAMLKEAAQSVFQAHQHGLVSILSVHPEGRQVADDQDPPNIISAASVAAAVGTDFVVVKAPRNTYEKTGDQWLALAAHTAGNTKIICAGGNKVDPEIFLKELHEQVHIGKNHGSAVGRNIFARPRSQAIAMTHAISAIVLKNRSIKHAVEIFNTQANHAK